MQGGAEYIRNAKIGASRELSIRVVYQLDPTAEIMGRHRADEPPLCMEACESSYDFALRFGATGDGFTITKDRLAIGCTISSCGETTAEERETIGRPMAIMKEASGKNR